MRQAASARVSEPEHAAPPEHDQAGNDGGDQRPDARGEIARDRQRAIHDCYRPLQLAGTRRRWLARCAAQRAISRSLRRAISIESSMDARSRTSSSRSFLSSARLAEKSLDLRPG